jgi:hypothetical protein
MAAHEPLVAIDDHGLINVSCSCGGMETVRGTKQTCLRGWDNHLALARGSKDAGSLNLILNALTDPGDTGPAVWRDLSRFPPSVVARLRVARALATGQPTKAAPPDPARRVSDVPLPPEEPLAGRPPEQEDKPQPDKPPKSSAAADEGQDRSEVRKRMGEKRFEDADAALDAFIQANREVTAEGFGKLTLSNRRLMEMAVQMAAGAIDYDLFEDRALRQQFVWASLLEPGSFERVEARMVDLLMTNRGARLRLRRTVAILEEEGIMVKLPLFWQRTMESWPD